MSTKVKKIFVVCKTHFDIGFTALPSEIKLKYCNQMVSHAIETCKKTKEADPLHPYVWTIPSWPLSYMLQNDTAGLQDFVHQGQVLWHALPFTTHTEFCGLEEYIRGMYISQKLSDRYGFKPIAAKMTDVPGHTWILPSLLYKAGVRFLHLGCNPCSNPPDVPLMFFWEGPDGNRILTFYSKGGYGTGILPPDDWDYPVWLAMLNTGDNHGAHDAKIIQQLMEAVEQKSPDTQVHFGTLDDFYYALSELDLQLPVIRKDLADCWIHGIGTYPNEVSQIRDLRNTLTAFESALCLEKINGKEISSSTFGLLKKAYENALLFDEHTWGMDTKLVVNPEGFGGRVYEKNKFEAIRSTGKYSRIEQSWVEKAAYVNDAEDYLQKAMTSIFTQPSSSHETKFMKVFNSLGATRDGWVELKDSFPEHLDIFDQEADQAVPIFHLHDKRYAVVKAVPPLSYKYLTLKPAAAKSQKISVIASDTGIMIQLENKYLKILIEKSSGGIISLINKETGKEWVDRKCKYSFGQYVYSIYSKREVFEYVRDYAYDLQAWYLDDFGKPQYSQAEHISYVHTPTNITFENTPDYGAVTIEFSAAPDSIRKFGNARNIDLKIILFEDKAAVDFEYDITQKQETPCVESGHFVFPLEIESPQYRINKIGSVIDPCTDIMKDANHVLYCCEKWVDISDDEEGLMFIPFDTPLLSIGKDGIERYSGDYTPSKPVIYFNAFNNQWGTNFPQWIGGDFTFRYRLVPHQGNWKNIKAQNIANDATTPLIASWAEEKIQDIKILLESIDSLEILTLKCSEDGNGYILRLRESMGEYQKKEIHLDTNVLSLFECDLLENIVNEIPLSTSVQSKTTSLAFKPFEILTLRILM